MKAYLGALVGASLILGAASFSSAQTPPGTDRPKGTGEQTSAFPKMERGGMKGTRKATPTKKATTKKMKKTKTAKRTKRAPAQKAPERDKWWDWRWDDEKKGKKR